MKVSVIFNIFLASLCSGFLLFISCNFRGFEPSLVDTTKTIRKDGELEFVGSDGSVLASIDIEIADTPRTLAKGLMGRGSLDDTQGMLFIFAKIKPKKFKMLNTLVPLDIIFIKTSGCVVNIAEFTAPMSERVYASEKPIKYAVEVRAGFAKRFKIEKGTCIRWRRE